MSEQTFSVGEIVTIHGHSDATAGKVVKTTAKSITVKMLEIKLMNGPTSGEPDALKVFPGGFTARVEGVQRWEVTGEREESDIFRAQKNGKFRSAKSGKTLSKGFHPHYDYNF